VDYLHKSGVIHKDIKPGNLLLSSDSCLKICDMGVAELLTVPDPLVNDWCTISQGTPKFQSPEIVDGTVKRFRGRPVDIWASAVTLFNMISGDYPFDGYSLIGLFENITNKPITWPTNVNISTDLHKFLTNTLDKNPENRWNSTAIRASDWFNSTFDVKLECLVQFRCVECGPLGAGRNRVEGDFQEEEDPIVHWNLTGAPHQEEFLNSNREEIADGTVMQERSRPRFFQRLLCPWRSRRTHQNT